jgi:hypothetical protein
VNKGKRKAEAGTVSGLKSADPRQRLGEDSSVMADTAASRRRRSGTSWKRGSRKLAPGFGK